MCFSKMSLLFKTNAEANHVLITAVSACSTQTTKQHYKELRDFLHVNIFHEVKKFIM